MASSAMGPGFPSASERHRLVVGVDFGTTYTGVSFSHSSEPDYTKIEVIQTFPGKGGSIDNRKLDKVPTELSYDGDKVTWGYQLPPGAPRFGCFKLLLDAKTGKTKFDDPNLGACIDSGNPNARLALPRGKNATDLTEDYLRELYKHLMNRLEKRMLRTLESTPIQFILTTPAIWSHEAQQQTSEAAKRAGFTSRVSDTINMISEPEAAATYCLREMYSAQGGDNFRIGDRYIICDCGGGTVDLITYTIVETVPTLKIKEAAIGNGGKCGSTTIDRAFMQMLEDVVGEDVFSIWSPKKTGRGSTLMMTFEAAKRDFGNHESDQVWRIPLGNVDDNIQNSIENGEWIMTVKDMEELFDPVVAMIIDLIKDQIHNSDRTGGNGQIQGILLVGGFGESAYLQQELSAEFGKRGIRVLVPSYSWSAISRGAVLHGLESMVQSRKLKQHYGVFLSKPFRPGIDREETAYYHLFSGVKYCNDRVSWFAGKGEEVSTETRVNIPFQSTFAGNIEDGHLTILGCKYDAAPEKKSDFRNTELGTVPFKYTNLPISAFESKDDPTFGRLYRGNFDISMIVGSADIRFEVSYKGKIHGTSYFQLE